MYNYSKLANDTDFEVKLNNDGSVDVDHYIAQAHTLRSECITDMLRSLFTSNKPKTAETVALASLGRESVHFLGFQKMTLKF
ncbi:MAG: hypothetical protein V7677_00170 [Motiliproteus sp.]